MPHNLKKLPFLNKYLFIKIFKKTNNLSNNNYIHIFPKSLTILKSLMGFKIMVYKGNLFRKIIVNRYIVGYKFGEFTHTRKPFNYPIVKKKKLKR